MPSPMSANCHIRTINGKKVKKVSIWGNIMQHDVHNKFNKAVLFLCGTPQIQVYKKLLSQPV